MRQKNPPAEPVSFEDLYAAHSAFVLRLPSLFGVPEPWRRDIAQEVWLDVYQSLLLYDASKGTERAWLAGIVRNASRDWKRMQRRRSEFSRLTDQEPPDIHATNAEEGVSRARQREALWSFIERVLPDEDQRASLLLHTIEGMTIEEVAKATGVKRVTAKWRIEMARTKLKKGAEPLSDEEREKMRALVLPLGGVDGILRALRETASPVSEEEIAHVWDRVVERIEADGGNIHDDLGTPTTSPTPAPKGYTLTGAQLTGLVGGVFLLGALSGAAAHAGLSHDRASVTSIEAEIRSTPLPAPEQPPPEQPPEPTATATATATGAPSTTSSVTTVPWESEMVLIGRARAALLAGSPQEALEQANKHAQSYPHSSVAADREEIAVRALVQLGHPDEAKARAAKLIHWAPQMRPAMESLFGPSFF